MRGCRHRPRRAGRGVALVFTLVMLALLTLLAVASLSTGRTSLQITDNAQQLAQAQAAAQAVLQEVLSSQRFVQDPARVFDQTGCANANANGAGNTRCLDLQGGGRTVIPVSLSPQPTCTHKRIVPASTLDLGKPEDLACSLGQNQNFGVQGLLPGNSLCADTLWVIEVQAQDSVSGATASLSQGLSVRIAQSAATSHCP